MKILRIRKSSLSYYLNANQEVALDEDPDNNDAEHAISLLINQISSELTNHLKGILSCLLKIVSGNMEKFEEVFWHNMAENEINPRALMVFLNYVVKVFSTHSFSSNITSFDRNLQASAPKISLNSEDEEAAPNLLTDNKCALLSASIYFTMLCIPGSRTKMFSSFTFRNVVKVLLPASKTIKTSKIRNQAVNRKRQRASTSNEASAHQNKKSARPARSCRSQTKNNDHSEVKKY